MSELRLLMNNTRLLVSRMTRSNSYSLVMEKEARTLAIINSADLLATERVEEQGSCEKQPRSWKTWLNWKISPSERSTIGKAPKITLDGLLLARGRQDQDGVLGQLQEDRARGGLGKGEETES